LINTFYYLFFLVEFFIGLFYFIINIFHTLLDFSHEHNFHIKFRVGIGIGIGLIIFILVFVLVVVVVMVMMLFMFMMMTLVFVMVVVLMVGKSVLLGFCWGGLMVELLVD
jgi:hypothetical protein